MRQETEDVRRRRQTKTWERRPETGDVRNETKTLRWETGDGSLMSCTKNLALLI